MGGTVAVTLREENGTEHRMARWTNPLPPTIVNLRMIKKDPAHIRTYLARWEGMVDDWNENKSKFKEDDDSTWDIFKFPMTPCYVPDGRILAPIGYGLVVIDLMKNKILSMQGYSNLETISSPGIAMSMDGRIIGEEPGDTEVDIFKRLWCDGRITKIRGMGGKVKDLTGWTEDKVFKLCKKPGYFGQFLVDLFPFTLEKFDESAQGALAMKGRIAELGFQYTKEDDETWMDWVRGYAEEE